MVATIRVNGLTLAHKGTGGYARSTLPDICKSPTASVPFVNVSYITTLDKGTTSVRGDGQMVAIKGSEQTSSVGDEPGVGGGVKSGTQLSRATWLSWSPNVFMEGKPVNRLTDKMLMNNGNTACLAGHWDPKVGGETGRDLCKIACECVIEKQSEAKFGLDACFAKKLKEKGYDPLTGRPTPETMRCGLLSNAVYWLEGGQWVMKMSRKDPSSPSTGRTRGSRAPDVTVMQDGKPCDIYELKFGKDDWGEGQEKAYEKIAEKNGGKLTLIEVDKDCDCDGYKKDKAEEASEASQMVVAGVAARIILVPEEGIPEALLRLLGALLMPAPAY